MYILFKASHISKNFRELSRKQYSPRFDGSIAAITSNDKYMNLKPILFSQINASFCLNFQCFSKDLERLYPYPHPYPLHLQIQKTAD